METLPILFIVTSLILIITPGQDMMLVMSRSIAQGWKAGVATAAGVSFGLLGHTVLAALGLGAVFTRFPLMQELLRVGGSAYLLWLAYQLLNFSSIKSDDEKNGTKPFTFWQATAFQYINPKAWVMVISANASFSIAGGDYWLSVVMITLTFILIGPPSIMMWAGFGQYISRFLNNTTYLRCFNITMASLTALCVLFIWLD